MKRSYPTPRTLSAASAAALLVAALILPAGFAGAGAQSDKADKAEKANRAEKAEKKRKPKAFGFKRQTVSLNAPGRAEFLGAPSNDRPLDVALGFAKQNRHKLGLEESDLLDLKVKDEYTSKHNGVTHVYFRPEIGGIEVLDSDLAANVAKDGRVINLHSRLGRGLRGAAGRTTPTLTAVQAAEAAARHLELTLTETLSVVEEQGGPQRETTLSTGGVASEPIRAKLAFQPVESGALRLAWSVGLTELSGEHDWSVSVDAETGEVLSGHDHVDHDDWGTDFAPDVERNRKLAARAAAYAPARSAALTASPATVTDGSTYNVFAFPFESPNNGPRTMVSNPADALASPFGWHDTNGAAGPEFTRTRGNNVHAYTDVDANNVADANSDPDGGPGLQFNFPFNHDTTAPSGYRPAAVVNLFYWNNIVHDVFYQYGFDEKSGNFQINNYGRGPTTGTTGANDDVRAEAQDGSGTNNANFNTNADGIRPRMQMFVWNYPLARAVIVNSPASIAGSFPASSAAFGPTADGLTGDVALATDAGGVSTGDACEPLVGFPAGKIALFDRGSCDFVVKVKNAQNAGAIAAILANNVEGNPVSMGGTDASITIPSVMVSQPAGNALKANLPANVTLGSNPNPPPNRDSDFDAGVIAHEYGHGISNRLTGGRTVVGCLNNQEQMGEGWSDFTGLVLTADPSDTRATSRGIGNYVSFLPASGRGIRPTPYTTNMAVNSTTYGDVPGLAVPHGVGYAWATMLWEMYWNLVDAHGYNPNVYQPWHTGGNNLAIQLVVDGMKLQPCRPGFVQGRDAILQADQALTGGENSCLIWKAFAKRGLGVSASQGSNFSSADGTEAFDLPAVCRAEIAAVPPSLTQSLTPNTQAAQNLSIQNNSGDDFGADLNWTITEAPTSCAAPADVAWLSASPANGTTPAQAASNVSVFFDSTGQAIGPHTAKLCIASDDADTPVVEVPVTLNVVYNFAGFFGQIAGPPAFNEPNSGSNVPVKFSLGGDYGLAVFAAGFPASRQIDCTTQAPTGALEPTDTPGSSALTYDPATGVYHYNWKTLKSWKGTCRQLVVRLNDGTDHTANFNFRK